MSCTRRGAPRAVNRGSSAAGRLAHGRGAAARQALVPARLGAHIHIHGRAARLARAPPPPPLVLLRRRLLLRRAVLLRLHRRLLRLLLLLLAAAAGARRVRPQVFRAVVGNAVLQEGAEGGRAWDGRRA